ncbi:YadA domain protein (plasmid) [Methylobacterium nodulans ORS 2060]|uniref:YadA domain protein n=2 Tax=Methylobacterium nodulans TaxID=114616 RepID=B8IW43_METNO|nr:YadA domain protein [Methylobacterium nodulans ORS 2060]
MNKGAYKPNCAGGGLLEGYSGGQRRRVMAVLRCAHRVLGMRRKRLGLGPLGLSSVTVSRSGASVLLLAAAFGAAAPHPAEANTIWSVQGCTTFNSGQVGNEGNLGGTNNNPADGSGTFSTIAGCDANGNGLLGVTLYGTRTRATGTGAVAIGYNASAAKWAAAYGLDAAASGMGATALGFSAVASGANAVSIGSAGGDGTTALSVANSTTASGAGAVAIGSNAVSGAKATATDSIAFGGQSIVYGGATSAIAVGRGASVNGAYAIALGDGTSIDGAGSIVIGRGANATGGGSDTNAIAIGVGAVSYSNSVALGDGASADQNTYLKQNGAVAIGPSASTADGTTRAVALGSGAAVSPVSGVIDGAMALGAGARARNNGAVAIGKASTASGADSIAQGTNATAANTNTIAIGNGAQATGSQSISIGTGNVVSGANSGAIGDPTTITGSGTYTLGNNNGTVGANESGIFGNNNTLPAGSDNSRIVGNSNTVNSANVMVMGNGVTVGTGLSGAVVLGNSSTVSAAVGTPNTTIKGTTYPFAGGAPAAGDVVSVGSGTAPRQIQNVAAGRISGNSTDAINGSQLFATNQAVGTLGTQVTNLGSSTATALGGGATYNATTGTVSAPSYTVNGNTYTNVGSALGAATTHYYSVNDGGTAGGNYNNNGATGAKALAAGVDASATGASAIAIGASAVASGTNNAIAIGTSAAASGNRTISIGNLAGTGSTGFDNLAMGVQSGQNNSSSVNTAIGFQVGNSVSSTGNVALGNLGAGSNVSNTSTQSPVFAAVTGNNVAVGAVAGQGVKGALNVAMGWKAGQIVDGYNNVGVGALAGYTTTGNNNVGLGTFASSTVAGHRNVGVGNNAGSSVTGASNSGIGDNAGVTVKGDANFAGGLGAGNSVTGSRNIALGNLAGSNISASDAIALGTQSLAGASSAIAIGNGAQATGAQSISIGTGNVVSGTNSGAIGDPTTITGSGTYTLGNNNGTVGANESGIFGNNNTLPAGSDNSRIIGNFNTVNSANVMVMGNGVTVGTLLDGAVVLGNRSTVSAAVDTPSAIINGTTYTFAGPAPADGDVVSVGPNFAPRQIQNVAAGRISGTSTDAINGSQLYATNQAVGTLGTQVTNLGSSTATALGGGASYNSTTGIVSAPTYNVGGGSVYNTVGDALAAIDVTANKGWQLQANGDTASQVKPGDTVQLLDGQNIKVTRSGTEVTIATANDLTATSLTTGNAKLDTSGLTVADGTNTTSYGANGFAITNGPSVTVAGIDAGGKKLTNLAAGTVSAASTEAVNGSQLYALGQSATTVLGGNAAYTTTGQLTMSNVGGTGQNTVDAAIAAVNTTAGKGWQLQANGDTASQVKPGDTVQLLDGQNIKVTRSGTEVTIATANDLTATSLTTGNAKLDTSGLTVADGTNTTSYGANGFAITNGPSVTVAGIDAGGKKLTNLAAGTVSAASTEAVNGSQLYATNQTLSTVASNTSSYLGGGANVATGTAPSYAIGGSVYNTVGDALAAIDVTANKGWQLQANGDTASQVKPGDTVQLLDGQNIKVTRSGTEVTIATANDLSVTSLTAGNAKLDTSGLTVADGTNTTSYGANGFAITGGPSVTVAGIDAGGKPLTGVAAGTVSAASTDAVNGSQLYATNQNITSLQTDALRWNSSLGAYDASHGSGSAQKITNVAAGALSSSSTDAVNGSQLYAVSQNIATLNDSAVKYDDASKGKISLAGQNGTTITNLRAGTVSSTSTDAINGSQLYNTSKSVATALGGGSTVNSDGTVSAPTFTIQGSNYNDVGSALGAVDGNLTTLNTQVANISNGGGIKYFHTNSSLADSQANGMNSVAVGPTAVAAGENSIATGNNAQAQADNAVALGANATASNAGDVALGSGSTTAKAVQTSTMTVNGNTYNVAGTATATVSAGSVGAERTITNVAAGRVNATSTDAINGSQLYATNQEVASLGGQVTTAIAATKNAVQYDTDGNGNRKNSITLQGGDANAPVLLSNVAAGAGDTDAVNVQQLRRSAASTLASANTYTDDRTSYAISTANAYTDNRTSYAISTANAYTDVRSAQTLSVANAYTDYKFGQLSGQIGEVRKEARQAAAVGLAAASLRYDDRPGKLSAAIGGGAWRGQGALAVGVGYTNDDQTVRANLSASTAGREWGVGAGLSFTLN